MAPARTLAGVRPVMTPVPAGPFGVITSPGGRWVFVGDRSGVTVLRAGSAAAAPTVVRSVPLPGGQQGLGEALTPDGRYLLVAATRETVLLNVARLESGSAPEVTGSLSAPGGAIEVTTSADGRFAFTSLEWTGAVQVSGLARALSAGFGASGVRAGRVPAPLAPVGEAVSPDGRWLYVTSEERGPARGLRGPVTRRRCPGDPDSPPGVVRVIGVAAAGRDPATAVRAVAGAGSSPVRVVLSPGGQVAWVTARGSNALLGFATSRLTTRAPALIADVPVGSAPVGVILVDGGRLAVVADSNRFAGRGAQWLSVVRVPDALRGRPGRTGPGRGLPPAVRGVPGWTDPVRHELPEQPAGDHLGAGPGPRGQAVGTLAPASRTREPVRPPGGHTEPPGFPSAAKLHTVCPGMDRSPGGRRP